MKIQIRSLFTLLMKNTGQPFLLDEATAFGFVGIKACSPLGYAMKLDTPKLGVLGGMGPLATVDFLAKLIAVTPAEFDQDHIPTIIYSAPYIPDRTANIRGHGSFAAAIHAFGAGLSGAVRRVMHRNTLQHRALLV